MEQNDEWTEARRYMGPGDPRQDVRRTHPAGMAEDVNAMRAQTIARRRQTSPYIALTCDDSGVTWLNVVLCLAPLAPNWPSEIPSALLVCIRFRHGAARRTACTGCARPVRSCRRPSIGAAVIADPKGLPEGTG